MASLTIEHMKNVSCEYESLIPTITSRIKNPQYIKDY